MSDGPLRFESTSRRNFCRSPGNFRHPAFDRFFILFNNSSSGLHPCILSVEFHPFGISRHSNGTVWQRLSTSRRPFRLVQFGLCAFFNRTILPCGPAPDVDCPMSENVQAASVRLRTPPTGILHAVRKVDLEGLRVCSAGRTSRFVGEPAGVLSASCARSHEASRSFVGALEKDKALDERRP